MHNMLQLQAVAAFEPAREITALLAERALLDQKLETWRDLMSAADDGMHGDIDIEPERVMARLELVEARIATLQRRLH